METVKEVKTAEEILKERLGDIHFIRPDETFSRVISAMEEFASIQTSELKAEIARWQKVIDGQRKTLSEQYQTMQQLTSENEELKECIRAALHP